MSTAVAVLLVVATGGALTFAATQATASVTEEGRFFRWVLVVFAAYLALIVQPMIAGM